MAKKGTIPAEMADMYLGVKGSEKSAEPVKGTGKVGSTTTGEESGERLISFATQLPVELVERLRDAAYWERATLGEIVGRALGREIDRMEKARGSGYERRPGRLRAGRPAKR